MSAPPTVHARWILGAVILSSGIVFLDSTIVNVALPTIGRELPATLLGVLEAQTYITSGYLAVLSALLILAGAMADRYGRRRVFGIGLGLFGLTSALVGLSPSMELLVIARLLQGMAGAMLVPGALSIITASFQGADRARAFGLWAAATSALTVLGPLIGGLIVDKISWRVAFLINVPLVLVALYATIRHVPESRDDQAPRRLDWLGSIVIAVAVGGVSFGLIRGQEQHWSDAVAFVALGIGLVAAVVFPILMLTRRDPLIPPDLFRRRAFVVINASTFLIYGALYVFSFLVSVFLQGSLGYTAVSAAAVGLPVGILLSLGSTRVGALAGRIGPRPFLVVGPVVMAAGLLWLARIPATSQPWMWTLGGEHIIPPVDTLIDVLPTTLLFAVGITLVVAPLTTALMGSVPVRNAGLGSAINNAISRVGQPLILAVLFIAIAASFYGTLASRLPGVDVSSAAFHKDVQPLNRPAALLPADQVAIVREASTDSFHLAMVVSAGLLLAGAAVNGLGLRQGKAVDVGDAEAGAA
jgi:EmrB/QacA subfamily drug resistance transporter